MTKETSVPRNRILVIVMLAMGGVLLVYALFHCSAKSTIPGWEPVNASLEKAMDTAIETAKEPTNSATTQTTPAASSPTMSTPTAPQSQLTTKDNQAATGSALGNSTTPETSATGDPAPNEKVTTASSNLLDLNQATQAQLETLPGIGPSKALAIVTYREQHNGFQSIDQLQKVKGIGPKMMARLSVLVKVSSEK